MHGSRLEPINADWLLVAHLILEADIDIVSGFQHLLAGLGEAGLVAIDQGDVEEARQITDETDDNERRHGSGVRGRNNVEQSAKATDWPEQPGRICGG